MAEGLKEGATNIYKLSQSMNSMKKKKKRPDWLNQNMLACLFFGCALRFPNSLSHGTGSTKALLHIRKLLLLFQLSFIGLLKNDPNTLLCFQVLCHTAICTAHLA